MEQPLTRDQERSLWLHYAVAARLVTELTQTLTSARRNLEKLRQTHPSGMAATWLARWLSILDQGLDRVLQTLVSRSSESIELRQHSPFAGVLSTEERLAILAEFRSHWRREHVSTPHEPARRTPSSVVRRNDSELRRSRSRLVGLLGRTLNLRQELLRGEPALH